MSDSIRSPLQDTASSTTVTVAENDEQDHTVPRLTVKLRKPKTDRKVQWSTETVDNENLNKKKSKCCCIYEKPRKFGESSSSDSSDDECEHCQGHVEKKQKKKGHPSPTSSLDMGDSGSVTVTDSKNDIGPDAAPPDSDPKS